MHIRAILDGELMYLLEGTISKRIVIGVMHRSFFVATNYKVGR